MTEIPMKMFWMGRDIDTLPHDELIEVVRHLGRELESARNMTLSVLRMNDTFRRHAA